MPEYLVRLTTFASDLSITRVGPAVWAPHSAIVKSTRRVSGQIGRCSSPIQSAPVSVGGVRGGDSVACRGRSGTRGCGL